MKHQCTQCQTIVDDMINVCPQCGNEDDFIELPNDDKPIVKCDLCGTPCTIEGEVTHYYKPIADTTALQAEIAELKLRLAVAEKKQLIAEKTLDNLAVYLQIHGISVKVVYDNTEKEMGNETE